MQELEHVVDSSSVEWEARRDTGGRILGLGRRGGGMPEIEEDITE